MRRFHPFHFSGTSLFSPLVNLFNLLRPPGPLRYADHPSTIHLNTRPAFLLHPHRTFPVHRDVPSLPPSIAPHVFPAAQHPLHPSLVTLWPCRYHSERRQGIGFPILLVPSYEDRRVRCSVVCRLCLPLLLSRDRQLPFLYGLIRRVTMEFAEC